MSHWKQQLPVQQPVRPAVADGAAATAAAPAGVVTLAAQDAIPPHAAAAPPAFTPVHEVVLPFGSRPFSGQQEARMAEELRQDTTPLDVRSRPGPGGKKLTYMPGWKSVDAANRIFGFNGWSSQVMSLRINFCRETSSKRWNVCVSCTVRVTLKDGSFHEDRGNGSAENYKSEAEALMLAEKEAVTDARKRALKNFGNRLGLSLYNDEHLRFLQSTASRPKAAAGRAGAIKQSAHGAAPRPQTAPRPGLQPAPHSDSAAGRPALQPRAAPQPTGSNEDGSARGGLRPGQPAGRTVHEREAEVAAVIKAGQAQAEEAQRRARLERVADIKEMQAVSNDRPPTELEQVRHSEALPPRHAHQPEIPQQQPPQNQVQRTARPHAQPVRSHAEPQHRQEDAVPLRQQPARAPPAAQQVPPPMPSAQTTPRPPARAPPPLPPPPPPPQPPPPPPQQPQQSRSAIADDESKKRQARLLKAQLMKEQMLARRKEAQQAQRPPSPDIRTLFGGGARGTSGGGGHQAVASSPVTPGAGAGAGARYPAPHVGQKRAAGASEEGAAAKRAAGGREQPGGPPAHSSAAASTPMAAGGGVDRQRQERLVRPDRRGEGEDVDSALSPRTLAAFDMD